MTGAMASAMGTLSMATDSSSPIECATWETRRTGRGVSSKSALSERSSGIKWRLKTPTGNVRELKPSDLRAPSDRRDSSA
eukprot:8207330-Pyramimonas_sp.AAC.1